MSGRFFPRALTLDCNRRVRRSAALGRGSRRRRLAAVAALLAAMLAPPFGQVARAQGEPAGKATLSVAEIYARATEWHNRIASVRVEYDVHTDELMPVPGQKPRHDRTGRYGFGFLAKRRWCWEVAGEGRERTEYTWTFDGERSYQRHRYIGLGFEGTLTQHHGLTPGTDRPDAFCEELLQLPSCDANRARYDEYWYFPHVLRPLEADDGTYGGNRYAVLPNLETVDGVSCHVLELRYKSVLWDKLWVDPNRGCMLVKRERHEPDFSKLKSLLYQTSEFSNVEQINGVWVGRQCVVRFFAPWNTPESMWNKPTTEMTIVVENIKINDVAVADIDMEIEAGAAVLTENGLRRVPGDRTVALRELADLSLEPYLGADSPPRPGSWWPFAAVAAGVLALGVLAYRLSRRK